MKPFGHRLLGTPVAIAPAGRLELRLPVLQSPYFPPLVSRPFSRFAAGSNTNWSSDDVSAGGHRWLAQPDAAPGPCARDGRSRRGAVWRALRRYAEFEVCPRKRLILAASGLASQFLCIRQPCLYRYRRSARPMPPRRCRGHSGKHDEAGSGSSCDWTRGRRVRILLDACGLRLIAEVIRKGLNRGLARVAAEAIGPAKAGSTSSAPAAQKDKPSLTEPFPIQF